MEKDFYKYIIDMSSIAYAYNKIVFNQRGEPCDFMFLEANAAFEEYIGIRVCDIIGKKATEVIPFIRTGNIEPVG